MKTPSGAAATRTTPTFNALGRRTRDARHSPFALCAAWEQQARKHLEHGPPLEACLCDSLLCMSSRGSASLTLHNQAFPGIYLTRDTIGLMALEPLQALALLTKPIYKEQNLSTGVILKPLTTAKNYAQGVLSGQTINDVFKYKETGGTALRRKLFEMHKKGELEFADLTFDIVSQGADKVVVTLPGGKKYDFHQPDPLLELEPEKIAVVSIEDGGASNKGICRVLASVEDPEEPGECCPASCLSYDFRVLVIERRQEMWEAMGAYANADNPVLRSGNVQKRVIWLAPHLGHLQDGEKNGFLVSAEPGNHTKHTEQLRGRMPVAEELAKATDAAAAEAGLSDFDLAKCAVVARAQGLDPRKALTAGLDDGMVEAFKKFRDGVFDAAKAINAGGCMRATTSKSRPSKRPRPSSPPGSPSPAPRNPPAATGAAPPSAPSSGTGAAFMTTWGPNASLPVQLAAAALEAAQEGG